MSVYQPPHTSSRHLVEPLEHARPAARLTEYKPWHRADSSLIGHATIAFNGGWPVHRIPVFRAKDGGLSVGTPSISEIDGEGRVTTQPDGSRSYWPVISFASGEARSRWQQAILAALQAAGVVP